MLLALALVAGAAPVRAQDSLFRQPPTPARVEGRIVIPAPDREIPVPQVMVTVHRVGPDSAGPLDSVRTDAQGRYRVDFHRFGSDEAVYFAAVVYRGIAYFSPPLRGGITRGDDAVITVFDTSTHLVPFTIQGHHVVIGKPDADGKRHVVEVFELSNDTLVTIVGKDSLAPVWSTALPPGATNFKGGQGDVAAEALAVRAGRVVMLAPFGPGVKQLSYSYTLDEDAFPLHFTMERQTSVLEVLLEEEGAQARSKTLRSTGNASTQGRSFKRFLSQGTLAGEELRIDVPTRAFATRTRVLVGVAIVIVLAMAAALARALLGRSAARAVRREGPPRSESLLAALAVLDARHEAGDVSLSPEVYASERASLKSSLTAALAEERRAT
jgi:hypothetical protein